MFSYVAGGGTPRVHCYANSMYKNKRALNLRRDTDFLKKNFNTKKAVTSSSWTRV
jgi:hypothetical protein